MKTWRLDTPQQTMVFASNGDVPRVVYWDVSLPKGEDLIQLVKSTNRDVTGGMVDVVTPISLCPQAGQTFAGQPGIKLSNDNGIPVHPIFKFAAVEETDYEIVFACQDDVNGLILLHSVSCDATGMFTLQTTLNSKSPVCLDWLAAPVLPVTNNSDNTVQITGRWCGEFLHTEVPWHTGVQLRESHSGRTGHETFPGLLVPQKGCTNTKGGVFAFHYGWSGGHRMMAEQLPDGRRQIQFGHATGDGPIKGLHFSSAPLYASFSAEGLNGVAEVFQSHARSEILPFQANTSPRPVHYNCWEAIYFNHKLDELKQIADCAVDLGAERFVLDDGWFGQLDDDTTSLGDWQIDPRKYPQGLSPLIEYVRSLGMGFGIWFEPEMISPVSELYHAHPEWVLGPKDQVLGRHQLVLDLAKPAVCDYLFDQINAILSNHEIEYVKWDHNRVLPFPDRQQAQGFYDLLDRLRNANPSVEFESCSSGGGRIDFGVLSRTHRVWLSDSNDALERAKMQHNAALWLPSEVVGSHVGPRQCHTSGRVLPMELRAWVAASRHMGFEMDPRELTKEEATTLKSVTKWYKDNRNWMHQANVRRLDSHDPKQLGEIQVSKDGSKFVAFVVQMEPSDQVLPMSVVLTGLSQDDKYSVTLRNPENGATVSRGDVALRNRSVNLTGQALMHSGLHLPCTFPGTIWVLEGFKTS